MLGEWASYVVVDVVDASEAIHKDMFVVIDFLYVWHVLAKYAI